MTLLGVSLQAAFKQEAMHGALNSEQLSFLPCLQQTSMLRSYVILFVCWPTCDTVACMHHIRCASLDFKTTCNTQSTSLRAKDVPTRVTHTCTHFCNRDNSCIAPLLFCRWADTCTAAPQGPEGPCLPGKQEGPQSLTRFQKSWHQLRMETHLQLLGAPCLRCLSNSPLRLFDHATS
eukprot:144782-Pelagomonas_calceolata.AAC.2